MAVLEALRGAGGDRIAEQHRVGEAVDGDLVAGGEGAEGAAEDRRRPARAGRPASRSPRRRLGAAATRLALGRSSSRGSERQVHADLGAAVDAALDLEAAGEGGDQGQADPQAGPSTSGRGRIPMPKSRTTTVRPSMLGHRLDLEQARLVLRIGMDDDVHAGLGDDRLQVGDPRFVHPDPLGQAGEGVTDDRHVLSPGGKRHLQPRSIVGRRIHSFSQSPALGTPSSVSRRA